MAEKKKKRLAAKPIELPDRPLMVLADSAGAYCEGPGWHYLYSRTTAYGEPLFGRVSRFSGYYASELTVHEHPQNDPEAVELIRKAHEQ